MSFRVPQLEGLLPKVSVPNFVSLAYRGPPKVHKLQGLKSWIIPYGGLRFKVRRLSRNLQVHASQHALGALGVRR